MKTIFILLLLSQVICGQKQDYIWALGRHENGTDTTIWNGFDLDFNGPVMRIRKNPKAYTMDGHNVSICDADGRLLLYSNGCYFVDGDHQMIPGSDSLNLIYEYNENCVRFGPRGLEIPQTGILLPNPANPYWFDYFHTEIKLNIGRRDPFVYSPHILHSRFEIAHDNRPASTIFKNRVIITDTFIHGSLTAIRHSNGNDWWIINKRHTLNQYYLILLQKDSLIIDTKLFADGQKSYGKIPSSSFSPDGKLFAFYSKDTGLELYNFNRENGLLSDFSKIQIVDSSGGTSGLAFSPNSKFIYITTRFDLFQYEVATKEVLHIANIGKLICKNSLNQVATFWNMSLGPDCRIYINTTSVQQCFHVIMNPDNKGKACNVILGGIPLPYRNSVSMPNFPHYRVDAPYPCDSSKQLFTSVNYPNQLANFLVFPNPAQNEIYFDDQDSQIERVELITVSGVSLLNVYFDNYLSKKSVSTYTLNGGIYFCKIYTINKEIKVHKIVIEQ